MPPFRDFIREIHRRSVWQVLGVYLVGSWGALEVVGTLVDVAGLPDWFPTLAVALLVIGLPIVLATAVVQEGIPRERRAESADEMPAPARDAAGVVEPDPEPARAHHRIFTWRNAITGGVVAFALWGVVAAGWLLLGGPGEAPGAAAASATESEPSPTGVLEVATEPPGATVVAIPVGADGSEIGGDSIVLSGSPAVGSLPAGEHVVRIVPADGETLTLLARVRPGETSRLTAAFPPPDGATPGMVLVSAGPAAVDEDTTSIEAFLLERHEVTNERFLEFVAAGGYEDASLWPVTMIVDGVERSRAEALRQLVDRTGLPGPRSWSGGVFPEGRGQHPVTGISWYEARAFARWEGKRLPTRAEWSRAATGANRLFPWGDDSEAVDARANFGLEGTEPVGSYPTGVSPFGAFDMAGNVREWVADVPVDAPGRRLATGGSWQDPSYAFDFADSFPPDFASSSVGFRCARDLPDGT